MSEDEIMNLLEMEEGEAEKEKEKERVICVLERDGEKAKELREWVNLTCSYFVQWR